jgi:hypothetical protein
MDEREKTIRDLKVRIEELRVRTGYYNNPPSNTDDIPPLTPKSQARKNVATSEMDSLKAKLMAKKT